MTTMLASQNQFFKEEADESPSQNRSSLVCPFIQITPMVVVPSQMELDHTEESTATLAVKPELRRDDNRGDVKPESMRINEEDVKPTPPPLRALFFFGVLGSLKKIAPLPYIHTYLVYHWHPGSVHCRSG